MYGSGAVPAQFKATVAARGMAILIGSEQTTSTGTVSSYTKTSFRLPVSGIISKKQKHLAKIAGGEIISNLSSVLSSALFFSIIHHRERN
jgi:hypothetical protein